MVQTDGNARHKNDVLQRARFALHHGQAQEAEFLAGDILSVDARDTQAITVLGYALLMQNRAEHAIKVLEPAARAVRDPEIDTQLGLALRQAGRNEDAIARFKRATKRKSSFPAAFLELGSLLADLNRYDEAIDALTEGLDASPMPEILSKLGQIFLLRRDYGKAKSAFIRALQLAPDNPEALWGLGKAHQGLGENREAADYFRRCLAQAPGDIGTLLNLGHSLLEIGDTEAGYDCFRKAARHDQKGYAGALATLVKSGRGRFWLKPSQASKFLRRTEG